MMTERDNTDAVSMLIQRNGTVSTVPLGEVSDQAVAWVDLSSWDGSHLMDTLSLLGASVSHDGLPVGWERVPSRASLVGGGDVLWVVLFMPGTDGTSAPIGIVTGTHWVVTIHDGALDPLQELWQDALSGSVEVLHSPVHALYEILETVADQYLDSIDKYQDRFDELEDDILSGQNRARDVFEMRRQIHAMRRVLADQRRVSARLARRATGKSQDQAFIDVYDAFYHVIDNADGLRDNLTGLVDLQLNQHSARLNEVMKFLTIFSTIFLPLSFMTGFLGMNLHDMSELSWPYVQPLTIGAMVLVAGSMLYFFKRKGWL